MRSEFLKACVWLRALGTAAAGGAAGALMDYYHSGFDVSHIDYHKLVQTAGMGAALSVLFYFQHPPTAPPAPKQ